MNTSEKYAKRACDLGIPLVRAESEGRYDDEIRKYGAFVHSWNDEMRDGTLRREDALFAMIIMHICESYSAYARGGIDGIRERFDLSRRVLDQIDLAPDWVSVLSKTLDVIENDIFPDVSNVVRPLTTKERNSAPEYLMRLYIAINKYRIKKGSVGGSPA